MGKILFSQDRVCQPLFGLLSHVLSEEGVPQACRWSGLGGGGLPPVLAGSVSPVIGWGTPSLARTGGTPLGQDRGTPQRGQDYPQLAQTGRYKTRTIVRRGQYASCIHTRGLSCFQHTFLFPLIWSQSHDNSD